MQRTSCQPREVCVEVAKEYPQSTSQVYVPRCVALHRCGGCCNTDAFYCSNTSYTLVNKTVNRLCHRAIFWRLKLLGKTTKQQQKLHRSSMCKIDTSH